MPTKTKEQGRPGQRRRTRKAIVEATTELLAQGLTPSVAEIADAADVSRRTVYLYFPTLDQLLIDATLGALTQASIDSAIESTELPNDVEGRVDALARAIARHSAAMLPLGRTLIRLTVDSPDEHSNGRVARGYRRIAWIELALAPLRDRLDEERFERLVSALAMVIGFEALIVLEDVRGVDPARQEDVTAWAARALLRAALAEADAPHAAKSLHRSKATK